MRRTTPRRTPLPVRRRPSRPAALPDPGRPATAMPASWRPDESISTGSGLHCVWPRDASHGRSPVQQRLRPVPAESRRAGQWCRGLPERPQAVNLSLGGGVAGADRRQIPYFRTEWLQKVMNLTTVRTHQFAVWITVGFFEVTRQGDPMLADDQPRAGLRHARQGAGRARRPERPLPRRSSSLDRTRAIGFNPSQPGDFRTASTYRQPIE